MKIKFALVMLVTIILGACSPMPIELKPNTITPSADSRITIVSALVFSDSTGQGRDVLILHDNKTGKEFLVVVGAGVVEITCSYDPTTQTTKCEEDNEP